VSQSPKVNFLGVLDTIQRDLRAVVRDLARADLTTEERVQLGAALSAIGTQCDALVGPIKEALRAEALLLIGGPTGTHKFETSTGAVCTVVVPTPVVQVRKDADMQGLKTTLGADAFAALFDEAVTFKPRPGFQEVVSSCPPDGQQAVMGAVEIVERTPKVHFKE